MARAKRMKIPIYTSIKVDIQNGCLWAPKLNGFSEMLEEQSFYKYKYGIYFIF